MTVGVAVGELVAEVTPDDVLVAERQADAVVTGVLDGDRRTPVGLAPGVLAALLHELPGVAEARVRLPDGGSDVADEIVVVAFEFLGI